MEFVTVPVRLLTSLEAMGKDDRGRMACPWCGISVPVQTHHSFHTASCLLGLAENGLSEQEWESLYMELELEG